MLDKLLARILWSESLVPWRKTPMRGRPRWGVSSPDVGREEQKIRRNQVKRAASTMLQPTYRENLVSSAKKEYFQYLLHRMQCKCYYHFSKPESETIEINKMSVSITIMNLVYSKFNLM